MKLTELVVSLALATGTAGAMSTVLDVPALVAGATSVSERAGCRTVETAIAAYAAEHDAPPVRIADVRPYLRGEVSGYRVVGGVATGPGCVDPVR